MIPRRLLTLGLLAIAAALGGCATSRSELQLPSAAAASAAVAADAPVAVIRSVKDERTFEQAPDEPSTPSLGFEGATQATAEAKLRAIGRKRNTFGQALGDIFLQEGQTVETVVRDSLTQTLAAAGYNVRSEAPPGAQALVVDVRIKKFWAWMNPGFWAITLSSEIATDIALSGPPGATTVVVKFSDSRQMATESAWLETVDKGLQAWRAEAAQKLPRAR